MIIKNRERVTFLKRLFFLVSLIIAISALIFFLADYTIYGIAVVGLFALWFLFFQVADYQYIEFSNEGGKVLLRYYKAVSLGKTQFNAIEFPQKLFHHAQVENSIFGKIGRAHV